MHDMYVRFFFATFFILHFSLFLSGQTRTLDSLLDLEAKTKVRDTVKVELLGNIAMLYYGNNLDLMKSYSDSARLLSKEIGYTRGIVDANQKLALYYRLNGNLDTALYLNGEALRLSNESGYILGKAKCNLTFANIYWQNGEFEKTIPYFDEALKWFIKIDHKTGAAAVAMNRGIVHKKKSEYAEALKSYRLALQLYQEAGDEANQALTLRNIAILYKNLGDLPTSIDYHLKALEIIRKSENKLNEINTLISLGIIYHQQKNLDEAQDYFNKSMKLAIESGNKSQLSNIYSNMAMIDLDQDKLQQALDNLSKAVKLGEEVANNLSLSRAFNGMGEVYLKMGQDSLAITYYLKALDLRKKTHEKTYIAETLIDIAQFYQSRKEWAGAEAYFQKAIEAAKEDKNIQNIHDAAKGLSEISEVKGNYKSSLEYYKLYDEMADSLSNETKTKKITSQLLNFNHERELARIASEQREKEHLQEQEKARIQSFRNYFALALVFTIIVLFVILLALRRRRIANENLRKYNEDILRKNDEIKKISNELIELDTFKQSMTSMLVHDLKSPLNTILNFPKSNYSNYTRAINMSGKAMLNLVENILDVQKFEEAAMELKKENFHLHSLISQCSAEIRMLLAEKNIKFHIDVNSDFICYGDEELIYRVIINLLTNAIKFSPVNSTIYLDCDELQEGESIKILIKDEGPGVRDEVKTKIFDKFAQSEIRKSGAARSTGLGLTFCKLAIEAHGGEIGVMDNIEGGAVFWFTLSAGKKNLDSLILTEHITEEKKVLTLNEQEKELLKDYIIQLNQLPIYKSSAIREIVDKVPGSSKTITEWKHLVLESVFNGNEKEFRTLTQFV